MSDKDTVASVCTFPENTKIPRGGYALVALNSGSNGDALPKADISCTHMNPAAAKGKLFLVNHDELLPSSLPDYGYVDAIGYGTANWAEGGNPASALSAKTAALRKDDGCTDTDNNGDDFDVASPSPRNSRSPVHLCNNTEPTPDPACGNGVIESGEVCDGIDLKGLSCTDLGYAAGTLKCKADCSGTDTSACLECTDDSHCAERTDGKTKCTANKCVKPETPECGNGIVETGEDCDKNSFRDNKTACTDWDSYFKSGPVSCDSSCKIDYRHCSYLAPNCIEGYAECIEEKLSIKECVHGTYVTRKCPEDKPYCKTGSEACSRLSDGAPCTPKTFIPHSVDSELFLCPIATDGKIVEPRVTYGYVDESSCSSGCIYAKRGYGVARNAQLCNKKGAISLTNMGSSGSIEYYACQKCKVAQDGDLYWLYVPAYYYVHKDISTIFPTYSVECVPFDDVE